MAPDLNAQTGIDLQEARDRVSFDLQTIRDYLFGDKFPLCDAQDSSGSSGNDSTQPEDTIGRASSRSRAFFPRNQCLTSRPGAFVRSLTIYCMEGHCLKMDSHFIGRVEAYKRALAITKRLTELQRQHGWTPQQTTQTQLIHAESLPVQLHNIGTSQKICSIIYVVYRVIAFEPVFTGQGSVDLVEEYRELVANKGIQG